jgi:hypothetical protein
VRRRSSTLIEPRVTCEELADELGWSTGMVITKLAHLRIKVEPDWADRPSVTLADAARAFERMVSDTRAHDDTWKSYQAYLQEREERRTQAANQASAQAREGIAGSPRRESRGSAAAAAARERFDADEPVIDFENWRPPGGVE